MKKVLTAGGVLIQGREIMLIKKPGGYTLPKGHLEDGETIEQAALREIAEETGLEAEIIRYLGLVNRPSHDDGEPVDKDIELFLVEAVGQATMPQEEDSEWVHFDDAIAQMRHMEEVQFLLDHEEELFDAF